MDALLAHGSTFGHAEVETAPSGVERDRRVDGGDRDRRPTYSVGSLIETCDAYAAVYEPAAPSHH